MTTSTLAPRQQWDGEVAVSVGRGPVYHSLRSAGSLAVRAIGNEAWLVGAGAQPIGGDRLRVDLQVGAHGVLTVRSTSATVARPSDPPSASSLEVRAEVAPGGELNWAPAPGIAARGSDHSTAGRVLLGAGSRMCWSEVVVLGRQGEGPGSWRTTMRVELEGRPLVVSELGLGPCHRGWASAAVLRGARCVWTLLVIDARCTVTEGLSLQVEDGTIVPVDSHGWLATSWGDSVSACRRTLTRLCGGPATEWLGHSRAQVALGFASA